MTLEVEERQSMKTIVHAEWASEDKMRDGMHMSATLDIYIYTLGMF